MLRITAQFEDTVIAADASEDSNWRVRFQDNCSGRHHPCELTSIQLGAILALAIGLGEDYPESASMGVQWLYTIADEALEAVNCPKECWPIP